MPEKKYNVFLVEANLKYGTGILNCYYDAFVGVDKQF